MVFQTICSAPIETVNEWIPVSERLPKEGETIVTVDKYDICECAFMYRGQFVHNENPLENVIAWMPIEPYIENHEI